MSKRSNLFLLEDILEAIKDTEEFIAGLSEENFLADKKTRFAVVRNLEVIGEASNQLSPDFKKDNQDVEWRKASDLRNKVIHEYQGIDYTLVWQVVKNNLPSIRPKIEKLIEDLKMKGGDFI